MTAQPSPGRPRPAPRARPADRRDASGDPAGTGPPTTATGAGTTPRSRRLSPRLRKMALATHVLVAVGWFGVVVAKLILEITAATTRGQGLARAAYLFMEAFDRAVFPPAALATLLTGIVLSVGTAWGLFQHYWIVVKLVLAVAVIVTGVAFVGAWTQEVVAAVSGPAADAATSDDVGSASVLIGAAVAHLLMLGAATAISITSRGAESGQIAALAASAMVPGGRPGAEFAEPQLANGSTP